MVQTSISTNQDIYVYPDTTHSVFNWYTVIVIVIVIILLVIVLWIIFHNDTVYTPTDMGAWGPEIIGQCQTNTNLCSEIGTQTIRQECIPNSQTSRGCLSNDNTQTFSTRIYNQTCRPVCKASVWNTVTASCIVPDTLTTSCVPTGTRGNQDIIRTCVQGDNTGNNYCVDTTYVEYTDSKGVTSTIPQTVTYAIGQSVTTTNSCTDFSNPICGSWLSGTPIQYGYKTTEDFTSLAQCSFTSTLFPLTDCISNNTSVYNVLQEGFIARPLSCVQNTVVYTPTNTDPTTNLCPVIPNGGCSDDTITPNMITETDLPVNFNGTTCSNTNNSNNPQCISSCRVFPGIANIGGGEMDIILNSLMIIQISVTSPYDSYLGPYQYPSSNSNLVLFRLSTVNASQEVFDVPLISIPNNKRFSSTSTSCSEGQIQFVSSLLFVLGIRGYDTNTLQGVLYSDIGNIFNGWVSVDNNSQLYWRQAYNTYDGPGALSDTADIFTIVRTGDVNPTPIPGMPSTFRGSLPVNLLYNNNPVYVINSTNSNIVNCTQAKLLLFEPTTNLTSRFSPDCSLYS